MCKKLFGGSDSTPVLLTPGDRVVLVGINKYPNAPLNGCVNDVLDMADFLADVKKFDPKDIQIITDERATTSGILEKLHWLSEAVAGSRAYFHFSGHGTQIDSMDQTEEDLLNEVICPVDFDWTSHNMITDKDLVSIFSKIDKSVIFNWASDSCHSGDLTRKMGVKSRRMPLPADLQWKADRQKMRNKERYVVRAIRSSVLNCGYVSGCRSDQTSADAMIDGRYCGAFTHYYLKNLKSDPSLPLEDIATRVCKDLEVTGYEQRPQAEGLRKDKGLLLA